MTMILLAGAIMLVLSVLMAWVLGWANKVFHVEVDPRVEAVNAVLPGANCGGCGCVGCSEYAEAVVAGKITPDKCTVGGESCAKELAGILGVALEQSWPFRPVIHCGAHYGERLGRTEYRGEQSCTTANLVAGVQGCTYGCLGIGDCVSVCNYDAIHIVDGLATVDYAKCVGCGACARICPRNIITMVPFKSRQMVVVTCSNNDMGKDVKAVCKVGCIGCKACERNSGGFFRIDKNLPVLDYEKYDPKNLDSIRVAVDKCPMKRLLFIGWPTEKDLEATKDLEAPDLVEADFKTTVDQTEWQG